MGGMKIKYIYNKDKRTEKFFKLIKNKFPEILDEKNPDIYLVSGGDGAMLHAIHESIEGNIPYFGKALGTFNFLMNKIEDDENVIRGILDDSIKLEYYTSNAIAVYLDKVKIGEAVNEIVLGESIMGYSTFNITTEHGDFKDFEVKGSGICISTSIGSTAFNFNNGGRILPLDSDLLSITGIVCNRYLNDIIKCQEVALHSNGAKIFLSNIDSGVLNKGQKLILKKGKSIKIGFLDKNSFLQRRIEIANRYRSNGCGT